MNLKKNQNIQKVIWHLWEYIYLHWEVLKRYLIKDAQLSTFKS